MAETTAILLVLGVLLAIVTLVGHGIWVFLAALFGSRSPPQSRVSSQRPSGRFCPRCFARLELHQPICDACGWPQSGGDHVDNLALHSLRRHVEDLAGRGAIDAETRTRLAAVLDEEELRIKQIAAAQVALPSPGTPIPPAAVAEPETAAAETVPMPAASTSPLSIADRGRKYADRRKAAAEEARAEATPAADDGKPPKRREALSRLFAAFMEEKNIRWGELVGGLLIVGCSIALVISFWSEIATRPLLKFVLFNGVTAALFGVGLYTDRRWKIHTTSHGILIIAALLVPLNFLAIAAFTQAAPPTDVVSLAGEAVSLVVFAFLVYLAGRVLSPGDAPQLVAGVMIPCLMQLLVRRFASPAAPLTLLYGLAATPIASYIASTILAARKPWPGETHARRVLVLLGLTSAATLMPLALLLYYVPPARETLHWLSPLVAIGALPALLVGLLFWRRVTDRGLSGLQTAGIGVGAFGVLVMAAAVLLAWPDPATLLPTALATAAAMLIVATLFGIPAAHVPAGLAFAAAWLVSFYVLRGELGWTVGDAASVENLLLSAASGHVLIPLVALFAVISWWLRSTKRREAALMYGIVVAAIAVASLAFVLWFGFARPGDPEHAAVALAVYALAALAAGLVLDRASIAAVGSILLLLALVQCVVYRYGAVWQLEQPWVVALLAHASFAAVAAAGIRASRLSKPATLQALLWSAKATSAVAAVWVLAADPTPSAAVLGTSFAWLAGVWLLLSVLSERPLLFTASQIAIVAAILCGITALVEKRSWYVGSRHPWLDPWFLESLTIALSGYCLAMAAFREVVTQSARRQAQYVIEPTTPAWRTASERLLNPPWPAVDHIVTLVIVLILTLVAAYAVAPGIAQELSPTEAFGTRVVAPIEQFEIASIPHAHATSEGAWMLLAAVTLTLVSGLRQGPNRWRLAGLGIAAMAACALLAARWEPQVAVASALRWFTACAFALASIVIWLRNGAASREIRNLFVALVVLIYVAMGAFVCRAALAQVPMTPDMGLMWTWVVMWALIAGLVGVVIPSVKVGTTASRAGQEVGAANAWALCARDILFLLAFAPASVLLTFAVARALKERPIVGPEPGTWFREIGFDVSYGVPLIVVALVFIGYAIRDRSSHFAFAAGLLFNIVATIVVLLRMAHASSVLGAVAWVTVAQVNAIVASIAALAWLAAIRWRRRTVERPPPVETGAEWPPLLVTQVSLAAVLCGAYLFPAAIRLAIAPGDVAANWLAQAGSAPGWIALVLAAVAACWLLWRQTFLQAVVAYFVMAFVAIITLASLRWDSGNWLGFHCLLIGCTAAAWLVPPLTMAVNRALGSGSANPGAMRWLETSVRVFAIASVLLAVRAFYGDPAAPIWTVAALAAISARNLWIAWHEGGRGSIWIAAALAYIAVAAWWDTAARRFSTTTGPGQPVEAMLVHSVAMALMAVASVWIERRLAARRSEPQRGIAFHRFAAWAIVALLMSTTAGGLLDDLSGNFFAVNAVLQWLAWVTGVVVALACLWDPAVRWPVACLYSYGLVAVGIFLGGLDLQSPMFQWALANALAAYSLATSTIWSGRDRLREIALRLGAPIADATAPQAAWHAGSGHAWLIPANILLGTFVLLLVAWIEQTNHSFTQRMVAAYAVGAQAFAIGLLARGMVRTPLQYLALVWGALFAVAFGWAWLPPDFAAPWLHRLVITVVATAATAIVYGFGFVKFLQRDNEWTRAAVRLVPLLAALAVGLLLCVLGVETAAFVRRGSVPIAGPALVAVGLALAGLAAAALAAALLPGRDPLGLSERGRTAYVYAAEALIALLCLHIRVTMPWLFSGWFQRFWPLAIMGIAFVGVGFGELFQRRRQFVLSEPLQTTGALLPLLPAVGFWAMSSEVHYSLLLLSIGVLYAALSVLRRSFWHGALAAIAANGGLWYLLSGREGLSLTEHPQLWLIPPALCVLAAGYVNRNRLTQQQSAALRYAAAIVIYVSSTADVFINGVADAPWLPAVLAGLSILGVLIGIVVRVRAFLYLGTAFLVVALMTIIWHAAIHEQRTWILWVAGIVTGALIIALFGLFEKRRDDVLRVVEELKHWQA